MIIDLKNISTKEKMDWLQHAIAPRPIGLVSTIDKDGNPNARSAMKITQHGDIQRSNCQR